jgi:hypothetical protein
MIASLEVHLKQGMGQALLCWGKNQIRALMTPEHLERYSHHKKAFGKQTLADEPFAPQFTVYKRPMQQLEESGVQWMWELKRDGELRAVVHQHPTKGICVTLQAAYRVAHIRIDTKMLATTYKNWRPNCENTITELASVNYQWTLWNEILDLPKVTKMRLSWDFSWSGDHGIRSVLTGVTLYEGKVSHREKTATNQD